MSIWRDQEARDALTDILRSQGYATYARLLQLFDLYRTDDDNHVAYMIPQKAAIVLNEKIRDEDAASMLVRHEILHEYLTHLERQLDFEDKHPELKQPGNQKLANIAGDLEISNRGYTEKDKNVVRNLVLGDKTLRGLVTEDFNPDWLDMTFEEMYEELLKKGKEEQEEALKQLQQQLGDLSSEDLEDLAEEIERIIEEEEQQEGKEGKEGKSGSGSGKDGEEKDGEGEDGESKQGSKKSQERQSNTHNGGSGSKSEEINKLQKAAKAVKSDAKELDKLNKDPFDTKKESRIRQDITARARQIADALKDINIQNKLMREVDRNIEKEQIARTEKARQRGSSGLERFKLSLARFVKNEVEEYTERTYRKLDLLQLRQGYYIPDDMVVEHEVPLINVYQDMSGSFRGQPKKVEGAYMAIDSLMKYVKKGMLKIKIYYVTERVFPAERGEPNSWGGADGDAIVRHVNATKPQNVIVITDSDANYVTESATVPGSVWFLFYDDPAPNLVSHLRGRRETRQYMIDYE